MNAQWLDFLVVLGFSLAAVAFALALLCNINYRITPFHLEITMMGLPVRRISHGDIQSVSVRPVVRAEFWCNTLRANDRRLVIERKTGWIRHVVISPAYRFVFRSSLAEARQQFTLLREQFPHLMGESRGPGQGVGAWLLKWGRRIPWKRWRERPVAEESATSFSPN